MSWTLGDEPTEPKTKHGLDKLELMIGFLKLFAGNGKTAKNEYAAMKSWLSESLKRDLSIEEELNLTEGILAYLKSDAETNERLQAMDYLFEAKFLEG